MYKPRPDCVIFHNPNTKLHFRKGYQPFTLIMTQSSGAVPNGTIFYPYSNSATPAPQSAITVRYALSQLDSQVKGNYPFKAKNLANGTIVTIVFYDPTCSAYLDDAGYYHSPHLPDWELVPHLFPQPVVGQPGQVMVNTINGTTWVDVRANSKIGANEEIATRIHGEWKIEPKCECGAESVGSSGHSNWCPKHT